MKVRVYINKFNFKKFFFSQNSFTMFIKKSYSSLHFVYSILYTFRYFSY
nr:MAG TPA: hypothetical protein [Caudoviricetes sp.]